jgi:hypothetical protein
MGAALTIDFPYVQQKEVKIINFSSSSIRTIKNIPWTILYVIVLPFYLGFIIPFANLILWQLYKKLQKEVGDLKHDIPDLSYKKAKEGYDMLSGMVELMESLVKDMAKDSDADSFLLKGVYNKFRKIAGVFREMQDSIAAVLYVKADTTPLSDKEKEDFKTMNDIWGDDSDQVYARHTHHHLTKRLKGHGV